MQILFSSILNMKNPTNLEKELTFGRDDLCLPFHWKENLAQKIFCVIFISCSQLIDLMIKHIPDFKNWNPRQKQLWPQEGLWNALMIVKCSHDIWDICTELEEKTQDEQMTHNFMERLGLDLCDCVESTISI